MNKISKIFLEDSILPCTYISQPHLPQFNPSIVEMFPERASEESKKYPSFKHLPGTEGMMLSYSSTIR